MSYKRFLSIIGIFASVTLAVAVLVIAPNHDKSIAKETLKPSSSNNNNNNNNNNNAKALEREFLYIYGNPDNPASVLVQVDSFTAIDIIENQTNWLKVRTKIGLPVWLESKNINVNGKLATLLSNAVIHSIPVKTQQTVAGELKAKTEVKVIQKRDDWSQILTPNDFIAWISKQELLEFTPKAGINTATFLAKDLTELKVEKTNAKKSTKELKKEIPILSKKNPSIHIYNSTNTGRQLITKISNKNEIQVSRVSYVENKTNWVKVSSKSGFPVWVHNKFVKIHDGKAKILANNVNVRTEPRIQKGTIIGQLNKGETLNILQESSDWLQVSGPKRFYAWVQAQEL